MYIYMSDQFRTYANECEIPDKKERFIMRNDVLCCDVKSCAAMREANA